MGEWHACSYETKLRCFAHFFRSVHSLWVKLLHCVPVIAGADLALEELEECFSDSCCFVVSKEDKNTKAAMSKVYSSPSLPKSPLKVLQQSTSSLLEVYMM